MDVQKAKINSNISVKNDDNYDVAFFKILNKMIT